MMNVTAPRRYRQRSQETRLAPAAAGVHLAIDPLLRQVFRQLVEPALLAAADGSILVASATLAVLLRRPIHVLETLQVADLGGADERSAAAQAQEALACGQTYRGCWTLRTVDDEAVVRTVTVHPHRLGDEVFYQYQFSTDMVIDSTLESERDDRQPTRSRQVVRCVACGRSVLGTARRRFCSASCRQYAHYHRTSSAC